MVKALSAKPKRTAKSSQGHNKAASRIDEATAEDAESVSSDIDDAAFKECLTNHENDTKFDDLVDKCFIILEPGKIKKVTCIDDGVQVQKDVYNVNVTTPIGETILLTAWGGNASDNCNYFT